MPEPLGSIHTYVSKRWLDFIQTQMSSEEVHSLFSKVDNAYDNSIVYPAKGDVFNAFKCVEPENVRVVIVGQDPYHGPGQAHGLSFSVPTGVKIPPSLRNILKEITLEYSCSAPNSGDLTTWANQGVLLLNSVLTVEAHKAGSHGKLGWQSFTDAALKAINQECQNVVFILWGNWAKEKAVLIDETKHHVLIGPHPSPLSAHKGFFGCNHFRMANDYLVKHNFAPIRWCLSEPSLFDNLS